MNIKKILKPTKSKLRFTTVLFLGANMVHFALIYFMVISGIVVVKLSGGFPISFYDINCELFTHPNLAFKNCGFHVLRFFSNILFWYGIAIIIKRADL